MNTIKESVIGIVGGMGPEAGLNLCRSILAHTPAGSDQDHLSVILMSYPKYIVDRTAFIEGRSPVNPAYSIVEIIRKLEMAGAEIVSLACNTAYSPQIFNVILRELERGRSRIQLINMPAETCRFIKEHHREVRRIGVMVTNGTYRSGVYSDLLQQFGYETLLPDPHFQNDVIHRMIYDPVFGLKSNPNHITNEVNELLEEALAYFKEQQADAIILGCTELSLVLKCQRIYDMIVVDAADAVAAALVKTATTPHYCEKKPAVLVSL